MAGSSVSDYDLRKNNCSCDVNSSNPKILLLGLPLVAKHLLSNFLSNYKSQICFLLITIIFTSIALSPLLSGHGHLLLSSMTIIFDKW